MATSHSSPQSCLDREAGAVVTLVTIALVLASIATLLAVLQ
jgi:hypothetical protein